MRRGKEFNNKHYCQVCKIWIENHPNNLRSHQEGGRHKHNLRKLLKSESFKESQKKKSENEVREEFLKMQGTQQALSQERKTIKQTGKARQRSSLTFGHGVFTSDHSLGRDRSNFENEEDNDGDDDVDNNKGGSDQKSTMGIIGQWEEVDESESVYFQGSASQTPAPAPDPFKSNNEGCVQIKKSSLTQNVYSNISEFEENQFGQKNPSGAQNTSVEKVKIAFKPRKTPQNTLRI